MNYIPWFILMLAVVAFAMAGWEFNTNPYYFTIAFSLGTMLTVVAAILILAQAVEKRMSQTTQQLLQKLVEGKKE